MNRTLAVCPTCAWPILAEIGQCVRCRPFATPESADGPTPTIDDEIARSVAGQMPSMAVFRETQQASAAEKQSEFAWLQAQMAVKGRRVQGPARRAPVRILGLIAIVAVAAGYFVLRGGGGGELSPNTPSKDLPWRSVVFDGGSTVELPGVPVSSSTNSDIGRGTRTTAAVPGATVAVTAYRGDYGMRGAGAAAIDLLKTRAADLGDKDAGSRIKPNKDRWGDAYDLTVIAEGSAARLRAIVIGPTLLVIEIVGPQSERNSQIFSRVINTLVPKR
ncbi:MAG: hypothetical protein ABI658_07220 [Acidimicrobiales bacterium]